MSEAPYDGTWRETRGIWTPAPPTVYLLAGGLVRMVQIEGLSYDKRLDGWLPPAGDNRLRVWHSRSSLDLNVVWARDHTHNYPPHLHDCAELVWLHSGRIRLTCRGASYQIRSGDL